LYVFLDLPRDRCSQEIRVDPEEHIAGHANVNANPTIKGETSASWAVRNAGAGTAYQCSEERL